MTFASVPAVPRSTPAQAATALPRAPVVANIVANIAAKIVIVDDERLNADALEAFLCSCGHSQVRCLPCAGLGVEQLHDEQPDLVLLELAQPDAAALLRAMQADRWLRQVPVIVLTEQDERHSRLHALELGAADFLVKPVDPRELTLRLRNTLDAKARRDQLAVTDALTGLPNRESSLQRLDWAVKHAQRRGHVGAVLQVGLARFKQINDAFGPRVGDELLRAVSVRLQVSLRDTDSVSRGLAAPSTNNPAMVLRGGGDEFTLLLPVVDRPEDAAVVAQRIIDQMMPRFDVAGHELFVTCNIGIAVFPTDSADTDRVLKHAGVAMHHKPYAAPQGVSAFRFYCAALNTRSAQRIDLEHELRHALQHHELRVHYQPKVTLTDGALSGAEALVRWQHPQRGLISPAEFIPAAEDSGLIGALGDWVLRESLRQLAAWRRQGFVLPRIAVNLSSLQFQRRKLGDEVRDALDEAGISGSSLCLELTESAIIDSGPNITQTLQEIKALGVQLALDDFGTGYSSLSHLQRFPIDEIKIDRSFLAHCDTDRNSAAIAKAIIAMGHGLGLRVVAEGVETPSQLEFIRAQQCDEFQGFLYSKPLPAEAFGELLAEASRRAVPVQPRLWDTTFFDAGALA